MSFEVVKRYYKKLKAESIKDLMAEDFIGMAISAIMILLGDKIATKFFLGEYMDVLAGVLLLAVIVIFFLGPLFAYKTTRSQKITTNLHELHQKNERRKDESIITQAQLKVVDAEMDLVKLKQEEILEKNRHLWLKHQVTDVQDVLKGKIDLELDTLNRQQSEIEFNQIMKGFKTIKDEFMALQEKLAFKKDEIENGTKTTTLESQSTKSKESKALAELVNPELNNVLADITSDLKMPPLAKVKAKPKPESELDLDKIVD